MTSKMTPKTTLCRTAKNDLHSVLSKKQGDFTILLSKNCSKTAPQLLKKHQKKHQKNINFDQFFITSI
jgi:rRNA pseudouridine-1189 N-methylase Emg1 (Nep1/Mra1 family)